MIFNILECRSSLDKDSQLSRVRCRLCPVKRKNARIGVLFAKRSVSDYFCRDLTEHDTVSAEAQSEDGVEVHSGLHLCFFCGQYQM